MDDSTLRNAVTNTSRQIRLPDGTEFGLRMIWSTFLLARKLNSELVTHRPGAITVERIYKKSLSGGTETLRRANQNFT